VTSRTFPGTHRFDLDALEDGVEHVWTDHIRGMLVELQRTGAPLRGVALALESDVPVGAGLSSSAAVSVAVGFAVLDMAGVDPDLSSLARTAQRAEHRHVGANVGIMDQFVCARAREGFALLLDTRSLMYENVPLPADAAFVVCNTMVKHDHATGGYNTRRAECEAAVTILQKRDSHVTSLRDVSVSALEALREDLPAVLFRRCRHVVTENARTVDAARALLARDLESFGATMNDSHVSMRDDYEISAPEVDAMVELARAFGPSVYGARMTGGGFGGSTVNLVAGDAVEAFVKHIGPAYRSATGIDAAFYRGVGAAGVSRIA
ncbi:MAG: galactokinase, partial [Candidatus Eremiobacteraeota bacterium]|nr:galactokinase [Candidatus Eremiobacteraeota bacterium]